MDPFIPLEKMSKKARRAYHRARRTTWGALNPVTRRPENPKAYNRKKVQREGETHDVEPFNLYIFLPLRGGREI
jgi:hypothetical protein